MGERTLPLPPHFGKWVLAPAFLGAIAALFTAVGARIRRHARQPALPRMSEAWLRTHDAESARRSEFWADRW